MYGIDNSKQEMIETCNYYEVLNCEETYQNETNYETEDNSMYTGDVHDNYYNNEQYYTKFYSSDDDKDETSCKDIDKQTWLGNTGASAHMTNSLVDMKNLHTNNTKVTAGSVSN